MGVFPSAKNQRAVILEYMYISTPYYSGNFPKNLSGKILYINFSVHSKHLGKLYDKGSKNYG